LEMISSLKPLREHYLMIESALNGALSIYTPNSYPELHLHAHGAQTSVAGSTALDLQLPISLSQRLHVRFLVFAKKTVNLE